MRYPRKWQLAVVCLLALALLPFAPARRGTAQAPGYMVTDLGTLGNGAGEQSRAFGLDECGRVVGESQAVTGSSAPFRPFLWSNGALTDLGTLGGSAGTANALNQSGTVVGSALTSGSLLHPFRRPEGGTPTEIGVLNGGFSAEAYDINASGQIVGVSEEGSNLQDRAFIWQSGVGIQPLSATWGKPIRAFGINDAGQIAGSANHNVSGTHAFVTIGGDAKDLGTLGGDVSVATKVNDSGEVSGYSYIFSNTITQSFHAFRWKDLNGNGQSDSGEMINLGVLGSDRNSYAYDLNNNGLIVGASETGTASNNISRAFIWSSADGIMRDLNVVVPGTGWTFQEAHGINNRGQIVGTGLNPDGKVHAFLLTPTVSVSSVSGSGTYNGTATLTATLTIAGSHTAGQTVSFTLNGSTVGNAQTDSNGVATLTGVSLSGINSGSYTGAVGAEFNVGGCTPLAGSSSTGTLTVSKATASITLGNLTQIYDGNPKSATATTNPAGLSGVSISYSQNGSAVASPTNVGSYSVLATLTNTNYQAADAIGTLVISKGTPVISWNNPADITYGTALSGTQLNATANVPGNFVYTPAAGSVLHVGNGQTLHAAFTPTDTANYNTTSKDVSINVTKATLTFKADDKSRAYGDTNPAFTYTMNGFVNGDPPGVVSGTPSLSTTADSTSAAGTYTITAALGTLTAADYNFAFSNGTLTINKAGSTTTVTVGNTTFDGQPHGGTATVTGAGGLSQSVTPLTYAGRNGTTYGPSTTAPTNAGDYTASASFAGDANHTSSSDSKDFQIAKASQTITFGSLSNKVFGDSDFNVSATASSGLSVSFAASGQCTISGATVHITGGGSCTITASQGGDGNFNAAADVQQGFSIVNNGQTITFGALSDKTFGDPDFTVSATATSGLTVSFSATGNCTVSGSTVHITGVGSCTVTASQAGDSNFGAATPVSRSFQIAKAATATSLTSSLSPSGVGQNVTFTATVSSGAGIPTGSVQFKVDGANFGSPVTLNASGVATLQTSSLAAGAHTVAADYSGDSNFNVSSGTLANGQVVGSLFEFTIPLYTVAERGGSVVVNVKRTGDVQSAATVEYATDDGSIPSVAVPCSSVTGLALERCDFTRSAGTLNFAASETQKTFTVLVNDDSYTEGTERVRLVLSNPGAGSALGAQSSATLEITDDSPESTGNPVDDSAFFVRQHYHDFLNREPDASGLAFWTNEIEQCGSNQGCREVKRINVSAAFFLSIEFQETGYLVERMYKAAYGDATGTSTFPAPRQIPVPVVRRLEFLADSKAISNGVVVGQDGWPQVLEANKNAFALTFVQRARFTNAYPSSLTAAPFVDTLFANAGVTPTTGERQAAINAFGSGNALGRAASLRSVAESASVDAAEKNRAFVLMQFFGYLQRNPNDAPDSNHTGYQFWLDKLNEFNGNYVRAEMVKAFLDSIEYRTRFAP
jgi:probable HAF family extracellular repeat protein